MVRLFIQCILLCMWLLVMSGCNAPQVSKVLNTVKLEAKENVALPSTPNANDSDEVDERKYSIFNDQGDHLIELVENGYFRKAASLYEIYYDDFFNKKNLFQIKKKKDSYQKYLKAITNYLNSDFYNKFGKLKSDINLYNVDPLPQLYWSDIKRDILKLDKLKDDYLDYFILVNDNSSSPQFVVNVNDYRDSLLDSFKYKTSYYFSNYDLLNGSSFFDEYPYVIQDKSKFIEDNYEYIKLKLEKCNCDQLVRFYDTYDDYVGADESRLIGDLFVEKYVEAERSVSGKNDLLLLLEGIDIAKNKGLLMHDIKNNQVSFIEATSKTLLKEGYIEFPVSVDVDIPFGHKIIDINSSMLSEVESRYVIIFDVNQASIKRRILQKDTIPSKYLSGYKDEKNPTYKQVIVNLRAAESGYNNAKSERCYGDAWAQLGCSIGKAIAVTSWEKKLKNANQEYINTPEYVQKEVYKNYNFSTSNIYVTKSMSVKYYVIDRSSGTYYSSDLDMKEEKQFRVAYSLKEEDTKLSYYNSKYDSENDIESFEDSSMSVTLSDLMKDYVNNIDKTEKFKSEKRLISKMLKDKNTILARNKKDQIIIKPLNDDRFDSVVVIYNPNGGLGTGFYVEPNLVLTNYHVVEGSKFLEMKLYNGLETFGKIVKSDVRLDLALIRVEARGKAVEFYESNSIELGKEVVAIGHPNGLEFSITRGIVSAIRERESVYAVGGKKVTFIQTDAAINPGNSGGPLFIGDKVIGVNNQKMVANSIEGLGFAVHCGEVKQFLKESF